MVSAPMSSTMVVAAVLRRLQSLDPALRVIVAQAFEDAARQLEKSALGTSDRRSVWKTLQEVEALRDEVFASPSGGRIAKVARAARLQ